MATVPYHFDVDYDKNQILIDPEREPTLDEASEIRSEIELWFEGFELVWPDYVTDYLPHGEQTY